MTIALPRQRRQFTRLPPETFEAIIALTQLGALARSTLREVLVDGGRVPEAAQVAGVTPQTVYGYLKRFDDARERWAQAKLPGDWVRFTALVPVELALEFEAKARVAREAADRG